MPGPPRSAGELTKRVRAFANDHEIAEGRVRLWIAHMALIGVLSQGTDSRGEGAVTVKGGVAVELRLGTRARTTKDLDLTLNVPSADIVDIVDGALGSGFGDFTFRRSGEPHVMPNGTVRIRAAVRFKGRAWTTVQLDLSSCETDGVEAEYVAGIMLDELGLVGPATVSCLPLVHQIAQKIHALTEPGPAHEERVRDLIDILLLRELLDDCIPLRSACVSVFASRGTHDWPPEILSSECWSAEYEKLAREVSHPTATLEEGLRELDAFLRQIEHAE